MSLTRHPLPSAMRHHSKRLLAEAPIPIPTDGVTGLCNVRPPDRAASAWRRVRRGGAQSRRRLRRSAPEDIHPRADTTLSGAARCHFPSLSPFRIASASRSTRRAFSSASIRSTAAALSAWFKAAPPSSGPWPWPGRPATARRIAWTRPACTRRDTWSPPGRRGA